MMDFARIIGALEDSQAEGAQAMAAARRGFLEWVVATPGPVTARMARDALATRAARNAQSQAARAFVGCLREASVPPPAFAARQRAARVRRGHWLN